MKFTLAFQSPEVMFSRILRVVAQNDCAHKADGDKPSQDKSEGEQLSGVLAELVHFIDWDRGQRRRGGEQSTAWTPLIPQPVLSNSVVRMYEPS